MGHDDDRRYPLHAVVRQREGEKDDRARRVALLEAQLKVTQQTLETVEEESVRMRRLLDEVRGKRMRRLDGPVAAAEIQAHLATEDKTLEDLGRILERCEQARHRVEQARDRLETAQNELSGAMVRLRVVQRHREGWNEEQVRKAELEAEEDP